MDSCNLAGLPRASCSCACAPQPALELRIRAPSYGGGGGHRDVDAYVNARDSAPSHLPAAVSSSSIGSVLLHLASPEARRAGRTRRPSLSASAARPRPPSPFLAYLVLLALAPCLEGPAYFSFAGADPVAGTGLRFHDGASDAQHLPLTSLSTPFTMEMWLFPTYDQGVGRHIVKLKSSSGYAFRIFLCPWPSEKAACEPGAGGRHSISYGSQDAVPGYVSWAWICNMCGDDSTMHVFFLGEMGLRIGHWNYLAISWASSGDVIVFFNGMKCGPFRADFDNMAQLSWSQRLSNAWLGGNPDDDYGVDIGGQDSVTQTSFSGFRVYPFAMSFDQMRSSYFSNRAEGLTSQPRLLDLAMDVVDCIYTGTARSGLKDRSGNGQHVSVAVGLSIDCPSPPTPTYGLFHSLVSDT
eukprot:tig00021438_g21457.t1